MTPLIGHTANSTEGFKELWNKLQKNETNKRISEIEKIRKPLLPPVPFLIVASQYSLVKSCARH